MDASLKGLLRAEKSIVFADVKDKASPLQRSWKGGHKDVLTFGLCTSDWGLLGGTNSDASRDVLGRFICILIG